MSRPFLAAYLCLLAALVALGVAKVDASSGRSGDDTRNWHGLQSPGRSGAAVAIRSAAPRRGRPDSSSSGRADGNERVLRVGPVPAGRSHSKAYYRMAFRGQLAARRAHERTIRRLRRELREVRSHPKKASAAPECSALAARIDSMLARYGSPMRGYGSAFVQAGTAYGVNPRLAVAISAAETTFGRSGGADVYERHNAWGWGPHLYLASNWPDAIRRYTRYLGERYLRRGLTTIGAIHLVYVGYYSADWGRIVPAIYGELGGDTGASVAWEGCE